MTLKIEDLLDDIRKVRNDLVAQSNPHFQDLTNIIYKWETKMATKKGEEKEGGKEELGVQNSKDKKKDLPNSNTPPLLLTAPEKKLDEIFFFHFFDGYLTKNRRKK